MTDDTKPPNSSDQPVPPAKTVVPLPKEVGGTDGPEPTRYGDWAHKGRVTDF